MRRIITLLALLVLLMPVSSPVSAVLFGEPDEDNEWGNVAFLVFGFAVEVDDVRYFVPWVAGCTGTLIDEDTVLSAAHCMREREPTEEDVAHLPDDIAEAVLDDPEWTVFASFEWNFEPGRMPQFWDSHRIQGDMIPHPDWGGIADHPRGGSPDDRYRSLENDVGLVNLHEQAPETIEPAELAAPGTLDDLDTQRGQHDTTFDIVGYGQQESLPEIRADWTRYTGTVQLVTLRSRITAEFEAVQVTSNPGEPHRGGACFGDSGGAIFYEEEVVAVNALLLNRHCMGVGFSTRVDTEEMHAWIEKQIEDQSE